MARYLLLLAAMAVALPLTQAVTSGVATQFYGPVTSYGEPLRTYACHFNYTNPTFGKYQAGVNLGSPQNSANCGRCVRVWCVDPKCAIKNKPKTVLIVDNCPGCKPNDINLSPTAFKDITGKPPGKFNVQWQYVDCGSLMTNQILMTPEKVGVNAYYQAFNFANYAKPLKAASINGQSLIRTVNNNWEWRAQGGKPLDITKGPWKVALMANNGTYITATVKSGITNQQWLNMQFK